MERPQCDSCEEPAILKLVAADLDGCVLDSAWYCKTCARGALVATDLEAGDLTQLEAQAEAR